MAHQALYRAWRPQAFRDMVGQQHIVQTLQNAIRENRLSHAYLFSGPRGTGKTSAAKILAKAVNCEHGPSPEPCNACSACARIAAGAVMDVVEIDAASNRGVDEIRDIRDKVKYAPTEVRRKVYIIDEVHMLTTEAFNALLKTLEEPPGHVMFVLATTEPHKLPPTIVSRCQRFEFRRVPLEQQVARLREICAKEGIAAEDAALLYIARLSDGGMRDALSLLDQIASFTGGQVTLEQAVDVTGGLPSEQFARLAAAVRDGDVAAVLGEIDDMMRAGKSADKCLEQLMHYFRDMLLVQLAPEAAKESGRTIDAEKLGALAEGFSRERLLDIIDLLNRYQMEMKYAAHPQTMFEVALIKLCTAGTGAAARPSRTEAEMRPAAAQAAPTLAPESANPGAAAAIARLEARLAELERKLEDALRSGAGGAPGGGKASGAGAGRGAAGFAAGFGAPASAGAIRKRINLEPFIAAADSAETKTLVAKWPEILQRVKEEKITVHAWLVDGEPAAFCNGTALVAFRNAIHRESSEKPANKSVIERVLQTVLGRPAAMATVLRKEWQEALAAGAGMRGQAAAQEETREELQLIPEGDAEKVADPLVEEAIRLFGEELVEIKED